MKAVADRGWAIAFAPDGRSFALLGNALRWYEVSSGRETNRWNLANNLVGGVLACTNDGPFLLDGTGNRLTVYDVAAGKTVDRLPKLPICIANFSQVGSTVFALGIGQRFGVWDLQIGKPHHVANPGHSGPIAAVALCRDGRAITADRLSGRWWDAAGRETRNWRMPDRVQSVAIAPDDQSVALTCDMEIDGPIHLLDAATGTERGKLAARGHGDGQLVFSSDGRIIVDAVAVRAWEVPGRRLLWERSEREDRCTAAMVSPDGKTLFTGHQSGRIRKRELATGTVVGDLAGHPEFKAVLPPGWWAPQPDGHTERVLRLAISPDSRRLISAAFDGTIRIWELSTGQECALLERNMGGMSDEFLFPMTISPGSVLLAAPDQASQRRHLIDLWDIHSGKRVATFDGHRGPVTALAFSPDGRRLISGGADTLAYIWEVPSRSLQPEAKLDAARIAALWADLADADAAKAFRAVNAWIAAPDAAVTAFRRLRPPEKPIDADRVSRLIADLDSDQFAVRDRASKELESLGSSAARQLRQALAKSPSPEVTRRIEALLIHCPDEDLRGIRAVEVLEAAPRRRRRHCSKNGPNAVRTARSVVTRPRRSPVSTVVSNPSFPRPVRASIFLDPNKSLVASGPNSRIR